MNCDCSTEVSIQNVEAEAHYDGRVYTQTVVLELLSSGISVNKISVFDSDSPLQVMESMVGNSCRAILSISPCEDTAMLTDGTADIKESEEPISKWSYCFTGQIAHLDLHSSEMHIDIDGNCILVELNPAIRELVSEIDRPEGRLIRIPARRTNVVGIQE